MKTQFVEALSDQGNWGKFMVGEFDGFDWSRQTVVKGGGPLLAATGWSYRHYLVLDMATGEGAVFAADGYARADLDKHRIWVCPLFQPFLEWLYTEFKEKGNLDDLPAEIRIIGVPLQMQGYRRRGPDEGDLNQWEGS